MPLADLRPLSLGELLDRTFTLYRNNFWLFIGIMALPEIIIIAIYLPFTMFSGMAAGVQPGSDPVQAAKMFVLLGGFAIAGVVMAVGSGFMYSLALGATTVAVSEVYFGRPATIRGTYRAVRRKFWRLVGVVFSVFVRVFGVMFGMFVLFGVLMGAIAAVAKGSQTLLIILAVVVVFLGMLGSIVLAVWLSLRYGVAVPAVVLEDVTVGAALKRSVLLTRGHRGRVFLTFLLMSLIAGVIAGVFQWPFFIAIIFAEKHGHASLWLRSLSTISGGIGAILSGPLLMIGLSLLYYDVRVRKEALDIQMMMANLAPVPTAPLAGTSGPPPTSQS